MTQDSLKTQPTSEDLARGMWEAVKCVGGMTSRTERDYIVDAASRILTPWLIANGHSKEWLEIEGPIGAASRLGYEEHLRLKEAERKKGR